MRLIRKKKYNALKREFDLLAKAEAHMTKRILRQDDVIAYQKQAAVAHLRRIKELESIMPEQCAIANEQIQLWMEAVKKDEVRRLQELAEMLSNALDAITNDQEKSDV